MMHWNLKQQSTEEFETLQNRFLSNQPTEIQLGQAFVSIMLRRRARASYHR